MPKHALTPDLPESRVQAATRNDLALRLPDRRNFIYGLGATLGTVALNAILHADQSGHSSAARSADSSAGPLAPKPPHHHAEAKACIFIFLEGGPSHIDTFDPKPALDKLHMK
jgi:hypothetical protein